MIKEAIIQLTRKQDLSKKDMQQTMQEIMQGKATPVQIAAFLTASAMKGITTEELSAGAAVMRSFVKRVKVKSRAVLDTCGTGGDGSRTMNISTVAALVVAGAGVRVAKHGNRAASSKCGSADLLETLGVNIQLTPEQAARCIDRVGLGFMFAPLFHPAMKFAAPIRRELGIKTIFNLLGPLTNPAFAKYQLLGVNDDTFLKQFAQVLQSLGSTRALIVRGSDGLDEITTTAKTHVCELKNGKIREYAIRPVDVGIKHASLSDLRGRDKAVNARIARDVLSGKPGPRRDIVCLNAGAALYIADAAHTIKEGVELARITIDSGRAREKLRHLIEFTNSFQ